MVEAGREKNAGLTELGQIAVTVEDVERATAFYRDVLGVPFLFDAPGLAFFDLGGTRLMLIRPPQIVHRTDNYELSIASFHDSEGNVMAIMHELGKI